MKHLAVTAALGASLLAAPGVPVYTCQLVGENGHGTIVGVQDCRASQGAIRNGAFAGPSVVRSRQYGFFFSCSAGGVADLPRTVLAHGCTSRGL
jgi:hypothetical protein